MDMAKKLPICPSGTGQHCSEWARMYMKYCLCGVRDWISLTLGLISVMSWGAAEIPQIITNYREKSAHGLSIAFLMTWIIGDLFNLFGCLLEPATLPTQAYMATLYTITTVILTAQTIYYGHICHRLRYNRRHHTGEEEEKIRRGNSDATLKQDCNFDKRRNVSITFDRKDVSSSPIPLPSNSSPGKELYYVSARSLSSSHTPMTGPFLAQRLSPTSFGIRHSIEEPLLNEVDATQPPPASGNKTMLCVVSAVTFLGTLNLHKSGNDGLNMAFQNKNGLMIQVGRKILQVNGGTSNYIEGGSGIGSFLGWAMAIIYLGGRLPQIWLNIRRGTVEGLNPLMFIFALVGNATYVASILVNSLEWPKIKSNLPWLVDAGGCVLLDTFILMQFIYFNYRTPKVVEFKRHLSSAA